MEDHMLWEDLQRIRSEAPLIHNITNYVVMNTTANALLAIGASPVMAHAVEEVEEMTGLARALVINIGTLSAPWVKAMIKAGKEARRRKIPIVLDPVGCGATKFRTYTAQKLMQEIRPTIIRGNASEIRALLCSSSGTKGVDSSHTSDEVFEEACELSKAAGCVVSVSGAVDIIVDGDTVARISNGHPMMAKVTGMGCTASAITGAFAAVNSSSFKAAASAMALMGIVGEIAVERSAGPGSFQLNFLDILFSIQKSDIDQRIKMQGV
ncbi:MAG: hydroxyethylthiazole kinase [Candidatus Omnitrophica bacterium]|nr:hydroxyethylthiazole kinase [Candidatus Omnitrophota bacterium]